MKFFSTPRWTCKSPLSNHQPSRAASCGRLHLFIEAEDAMIEGSRLVRAHRAGRGTRARRRGHRICRETTFAKNETAGEKLFASRLPLLPGGSGRKSLDRFLQFLRGAERDFLAGLNLDLLAGCGVATDTGSALAHLKNAKTANTNAFALLQMLHNISD